MLQPPDLQDIAEAKSRITRLIQQMDDLLAQGAAAEATLEAHYAATGITPGIGRRVLLSKAMPRDDQYILGRLLEEYELIEERLKEFRENSHHVPSAPPAAGPRAVASRYRI